MYTAPGGTQKFFVRDLTFSNLGPSAVRVRMSIGDITNPSKRLVDQDIAANTTTSLRPLWLLDAGETLQGVQLVNTAMTVTAVSSVSTTSDGAFYDSVAWVPAANTMYLLVFHNTDQLSQGAPEFPTSITGNGTWTLINQVASSVGGGADNIATSAYYWYSTAAGASASTRVNFATTQGAIRGSVFSVTNVYAGTAAVPPWTSSAVPIIQSAAAADTTAPASTNQSVAVTLPSTIQTGYVFHVHGRVDASAAVTPPTGWTEDLDMNISDGTSPIEGALNHITTPPFTSQTPTAGTYTTSLTTARTAIAWEMIPSSFVNCMASGIEVH
jgi:hypothetical protein